MVLANWQLLTVQLLPRGADVAVHVIKKSENKFKKNKKNLKKIFRKKKSEKKTLKIKIFEKHNFLTKNC